jgi:hypothetical protein
MTPELGLGGHISLTDKINTGQLLGKDTCAKEQTLKGGGLCRKWKRYVWQEHKVTTVKGWK